MHNRKGRHIMKETLEAVAALGMLAVVMGLAYAAGCMQ